MTKKILIFADSRGQHKRGDYPLYWERLSEKYQVDAYLCPYKWTTTVDFLELICHGIINPRSYDAVILHTGIVEWSPRPFNNAYHELYNPPDEANLDNLSNNTRDYSQKIRNRKKTFYDWLFKEDKMTEHFSAPFSTEFEGEMTINMYSRQLMVERVIPALKTMDNLIWISCNPILLDWRGTYFRDRPQNIKMIELYSEEMASYLPKVVNLNKWTEEEIKKYTLDNMHLTQAGSDYIYDRLEEFLADF